MREHIAAIEALLVPLGVATYYVDVPEKPAAEYVLLWGSNGVPSTEQSVDAVGDFTDQVGVTCVSGTPYGVLLLRDEARVVLDGARPIITGRAARLDLVDSRPTTVDRDVTPHVPYGVDLYRLVSVPA